jgi:hypothetical protein
MPTRAHRDARTLGTSRLVRCWARRYCEQSSRGYPAARLAEIRRLDHGSYPTEFDVAKKWSRERGVLALSYGENPISRQRVAGSYVLPRAMTVSILRML